MRRRTSSLSRHATTPAAPAAATNTAWIAAHSHGLPGVRGEDLPRGGSCRARRGGRSVYRTASTNTVQSSYSVSRTTTTKKEKCASVTPPDTCTPIAAAVRRPKEQASERVRRPSLGDRTASRRDHDGARVHGRVPERRSPAAPSRRRSPPRVAHSSRVSARWRRSHSSAGSSPPLGSLLWTAWARRVGVLEPMRVASTARGPALESAAGGVEVLQEVVRGELDLLVAPLGGAVHGRRSGPSGGRGGSRRTRTRSAPWSRRWRPR